MICDYVNAENVEIPEFYENNENGFGLKLSRNTLSRLNSLNPNTILLKSSTTNDTKVPNVVDYADEIGPVHEQSPYGTCYIEAATTLIEWIIWRITGEKVAFTKPEIWDIGADCCYNALTQGGYSYSKRQEAGTCPKTNNSNKCKNKNSKINKIISDGDPYDVFIACYNYNSELKLNDHYWTNKQPSSLCAKFKQLIDESLISIEQQLISPSNSIDEMKYALFQYGPVAVNVKWKGNKSKAHSVLGIGYDRKKIYIRNSWGSSTPYGIEWNEWKDKWALTETVNGKTYGYNVYVKSQLRNTKFA